MKSNNHLETCQFFAGSFHEILWFSEGSRNFLHCRFFIILKKSKYPEPGSFESDFIKYPEPGSFESDYDIPYKFSVGSLMYAMVCSWPDIIFSIGVISQYLSNPGLAHWSSVERILRYLKGPFKLEIICLNEDLYLFF